MLRARIGLLFSGESLVQRAARGSALTIISFGGMQAIRLVSNLILTRLLFPETFGLMTLIMVIIQGLNNFSDVGITPAILQSKRGDDRTFLDTAFTMQAIRGVVLWLGCCILAVPAARFYDVPELVWFLPVAATTTVIFGLLATKVETANRHLRMGRLTMVELAVAAITTAITIILAALLGSAWALVIGLIIGALVKVAMVQWLMPGPSNRFRWDADCAAELISFGKWILPSTVVGFAISQGDKAVLARLLSLTDLGIYNIAFFLASFPLMLGVAVISRVMIPIYRATAEDPTPHRMHRLRLMRTAMTASFMVLLALLATFGADLVALMYDERYQSAGPLVTLIALASIPSLVGLSYDQAALAGGDSRGFFWVTLVRAVLFLSLFTLGAWQAGIPGALAGQAMAAVLAYPMLVRIARRHGVWDGWHDLGFAIAGLILTALLLV
ncbi:oligosaccharide flippase family protein [Paracoccus nototheniae]|uniref:Oligosaccharide flippase family protein n=1 Tax=Paracoccus nototheniae TaxID=2489002 RepID=A0ABW4DWM8_9RHOB|nr:oligosaccharide flippase family protein [Paracoccus nototheniae]